MSRCATIEMNGGLFQALAAAGLESAFLAHAFLN